MFPEHLQSEWWEKPSTNRNDDEEKVIIECQTKACQIALLTAPHTCPLIFLPLDLCSCAPEVWNGLLPPLSQCQVLIIFQDLAQILSVWIFPYIPTLAPHFHLFLPLWYSPKVILTITVFLLSVSFNVSPPRHSPSLAWNITVTY